MVSKVAGDEITDGGEVVDFYDSGREPVKSRRPFGKKKCRSFGMVAVGRLGPFERSGWGVCCRFSTSFDGRRNPRQETIDASIAAMWMDGRKNPRVEPGTS